ncbi:MAG: hypothetical protein ACR2L3_03615 [Actinomycetota bacterium]
MLELDSDLFQTAVLGLLVLSLLFLLLVLNTLSKIRKTLEDALSRSGIGDITSPQAADQPSAASLGAPAASSTEAAWGGAAAAAPAVGTVAGESGSWAAPAETAGSGIGETGTWADPTAGAGAGETGTWAAPAETAAAPVQAQTFESQPAAGSIQAAPTQAAPNPGDMPEEQPVEHEGRWWFKRGSELLIYDESTGQWGPAPQVTGDPTGGMAAGSPGSVGSAYSAFKDLGEATSKPEPAAGGGAAGESAGFWKCTSCGAVNGTTAESCRMCFAPHS